MPVDEAVPQGNDGDEAPGGNRPAVQEPAGILLDSVVLFNLIIVGAFFGHVFAGADAAAPSEAVDGHRDQKEERHEPGDAVAAVKILLAGFAAVGQRAED